MHSSKHSVGSIATTASSLNSREPLLAPLSTTGRDSPLLRSSGSSSPSIHHHDRDDDDDDDDDWSPLANEKDRYGSVAHASRSTSGTGSPTSSAATTTTRMFHSNGWKAVGSGGGSYTNGDVRSRMLAAVRPFVSTKRNLALTVVVATFALFALFSHSSSTSSTRSSSSSTSSSHYRLPASRFNPSSWRSPFSFSFSGHAATCTPHAPTDLRDRFERASRPLDPDASTQQRLDDWEFEAPGWGVEPADWVRRNVEVRLLSSRVA